MGTIRDRGIIKWQAALMLPEHKALNKKKDKDDYFLNKKPILDEYQVEENNIHYAMEVIVNMSSVSGMEGKGRKLKASKVKKQLKLTCYKIVGLQEVISESIKVKAGNHELSMVFPLFIILYLSYI
ncbi:hypothetical protein [Peribacillus sp. FSL M8-0224]|uniref:hypothetical protein n=1 Tax=Peribacillus sp. FSL M8-0224 TaxID=2921568 RepID=UPI0030FA6E2B|nr:YolD-like family protein [Brevibacterium sp. PAMC21349]